MEARGRDLPAGEAVSSEGYCLPSPYVIHTVGPQLHGGASPSDEDTQQLRQCYWSVLEQADSLPPNGDGTKRVALCGISTGLFAFPTLLAAEIAVNTVTAWVAHNEDVSITDIIFTTFAEGDYEIYDEILSNVQAPWHEPDQQISPAGVVRVEGNTLESARLMLESADTVIISVGAGFSAADGLDYTSRALFKKYFPSFIDMGLETLYGAIGFEFPSEEEKWAYYFTNIRMMRSWSHWPLYDCLMSWLKSSGKDAHIRTSNADGLFLTNGWEEERLSTPQGRYSVLQCLATCRSDSVFDTLPFYEAAQPFLDAKTQRLTDPSKVPRCPNCGGKMMLCVRGGNWFNDQPFKDGEARWRKFKHDVLQQARNTVVLELGVGMNTPGVLRWPNEDLVREGAGRVKLVRVGLGPSAAVPGDLQAKGVAVSVEGDLKLALPWILGVAKYRIASHWHLKFILQNRCVYSQTYFENNYPDLCRWTKSLPNASSSCFVTFGLGLGYFASAPGQGSIWAGIPSEMEDKLRKSYETPCCVALGAYNSWFVLWPGGDFSWKFHGHYSALEKILSEAAPQSVSYVAISPYNEQHYFVAFRDQSVKYNFIGAPPEWMTLMTEAFDSMTAARLRMPQQQHLASNGHAYPQVQLHSVPRPQQQAAYYYNKHDIIVESPISPISIPSFNGYTDSKFSQPAPGNAYVYHSPRQDAVEMPVELPDNTSSASLPIAVTSTEKKKRFLSRLF
ncbi:hypothetical protein E8E13_004722 [Curvularia kusanoi]|uniref:Macro domain-containing protein n=1 Tax=Curvularia kusanoi TaxID=90978 RepID=A0A9P4T8N2_CURKU|nr:hypothetical protein E8E13_004722 [Curvularia kusanoi]